MWELDYKKAEHRRIDAFELWFWRRLLRVPWTARRSNQSILKELSPGCSLVGLMLKLKLQCFGHLMQRADSFAKTLMLRKIKGGKRRGWQRMRRLDGIINSMDMSVGKLWELVIRQGGLACCGPWGHKELDTTKRLNWTELNWTERELYSCPGKKTEDKYSQLLDLVFCYSIYFSTILTRSESNAQISCFWVQNSSGVHTIAWKTWSKFLTRKFKVFTKYSIL